MPIELKGDRKDRLVKALDSALQKVTAANGMFINRSSGLALAVADAALPKEGKLHERLIEYVDEFPFFNFVLSMLGRELSDLDKYQAEVDSVVLTDIEGYEDTSVVATRLVDSFLSLPWKYTLSFPLPEQLSGLLRPTVDEVILGPHLKLARATDEFAIQFPLSATTKGRQRRVTAAKGLLSLLNPDPPTYKAGTIFLQVHTEGFIGDYGGSSPVVGAERVVRAFYGLGIAERLFDHKPNVKEGPKAYFYVHRQNKDETWIPENRLDVEDTTHRGLGSLTLHDLDGFLKTNEAKLNWAANRLNDIAAVFSAGDKADPIVLASHWLFDSHANVDELLNFIQAMIVLEILLGDKKAQNEIGLSALMRNRCAYLIGTSQEDRDEIMQLFNKLYDIRSQIVHAGKHRLTFDERVLFSRLHWISRRVIVKEIELLRANKKSIG